MKTEAEIEAEDFCHRSAWLDIEKLTAKGFTQVFIGVKRGFNEVVMVFGSGVDKESAAKDALEGIKKR